MLDYVVIERHSDQLSPHAWVRQGLHHNVSHRLERRPECERQKDMKMIVCEKKRDIERHGSCALAVRYYSFLGYNLNVTRDE